MSDKNDFVMTAIKVASWIIFIGLCIQTGAFIFNYFFSLFNPVATHNLYLELDLSQVYEKSKRAYAGLFSFLIALSALKAYVFYLVLRMFEKLNLVKPFSEEMSALISKISYFAFFIGFLGYIAHNFTKELMHKGYEVDAVESYWNDTGAYLMMAAIVFVIAQIYKKGIELQIENDLTV